MSALGQPTLQQDNSYAMCHIPVWLRLKNMTSAVPASPGVWTAPGISYIGLTCHMRWCRACAVCLVLVLSLSVAKAVNVVLFRVAQFQTRSAVLGTRDGTFPTFGSAAQIGVPSSIKVPKCLA